MAFPSAILFDLLISGHHKNRGAIERELHNGVNPNLVHPIYGVSAMHLASGQGEEATQFMLLHGGDLNIVSLEGLTPLHVAASWGDLKTLQLLLRNGADINIHDQDGKTAYDLAVEGENKECAQLLQYLSVVQTVKDSRTSPSHVDLKRNVIIDGKNCCQNSVCDHGKRKNLACHISNSVHEFEAPLEIHSDTVTKRIYNYLEEGKQVYFDATSPDTPVLGIKPAETAYADGHDCACQEHLHDIFHHRDLILQNTDMPKFSLSHESSCCSFTDDSRACKNFIHDHSRFNGIPSVPVRETSLNGIPISYPHHMCQVCRSRNFDHSFCTDMSPHSYTNTQNQSLNCARSPVLSGSYRMLSNAGFCCKMRHNTRSPSPNHSCCSHFVNSSSGSFSTLCKGKLPGSFLPPIDKENQLSMSKQSPEMTYVDKSTIKTQVFSLDDLKCCKNPNSCETSPNRPNTHISSKDCRSQKKSEYLNRCILPLSETKTDALEIFDTGSPTRMLECKYKKQGIVGKTQTRFNPNLNFAKVSTEHPLDSSVSDYFSAPISLLHGSAKKVLKDEIVVSSEMSKEDVIKSDQISGTVLNAGKLFPPLLNGCTKTSCIDGSKNSVLEVKENFTTNINNNRKKPKRRSFLHPQETAALLPKSQLNPHQRVAEFILSVQNLMTECSFENCDNDSLTVNLSPRSEENTLFSECQEQNSIGHTEQTMVEHHSRPEERTNVTMNTSSSSIDTFATCDEGYINAFTNVNTLREVEKESTLNGITAKETHDAARIRTVVSSVEKMTVEDSSSKSKSPTKLLEASPSKWKSPTKLLEDSPSKWKSPTLVLPDDDIMTSDDSYIHNTHSRVYRMKFKPKFTSHNERAPSTGKQNHVVSTKPSQEIVKRENPVEIFPAKKRSSSDSLFSTISVKEYIYRDKEMNITLIERHIPSDCGSSVGRRSLESANSRATLDSEATVIYDWHALNEVLNDESLKVQSSSSGVPNSHYKKEMLDPDSCDVSWPQKHIGSLQNKYDDHSSSDNTVHSSESIRGDDDYAEEKTAGIIIPAHLEKMTCQEISQELQKYGEIPGPVIPVTRQAYLRRLATLESNPGLMTLSKTCPDYPPEMRQALNGQFDSSGLVELESKMVEVFSMTKNGHCWREGTVKSSFTYLLLDPRVTDNLPLRAKNMSDLEVFKTFICSIFYIGKGKRSRPYSHLYEAVSKMNKLNAKMSTKVKQIVDIWNAGLGVVSLHCFQSVIPVEAYTREACMITAIGVHKLTNMKQGDIYGAASSWTASQRRKMGVYLLKKALQIFLAEGERQICLPDLKNSQSP